jgi:DNA polymerase-3 subunit delta'
MAWADFSEPQPAVELLQRSLERGRLGHAYLFAGDHLTELEAAARTLAKTLNCQQSIRGNSAGAALDSCDTCSSCRKIETGNHPDVQWVRPESKLRLITIDQIRDLLQAIQLKPAEARFKVGVIVAADRLNVQAANAFLKTLEEPPGKSVLVLLCTEPQRLLETIVSRCLRLNFGSESAGAIDEQQGDCIKALSQMAAGDQKGLLGRYRLLGVLLGHLAGIKAEVEQSVASRSPLERYDEVEPKLREKWEDELAAAIEAEYRRRRADLLLALQWWLRDVWLHTFDLRGRRLKFPALAVESEAVAERISVADATANLEQIEATQRLLAANVQEALALEVGFLKLRF